jgi:hypothetical protein
MSTPYIFHRASGWYPIELADDGVARANALSNPGTISVENAVTGETVWRADVVTGTELISIERQRQISKEGYTQQHDDERSGGTLVTAAIAYAIAAQRQFHLGKIDLDFVREMYWPFEARSWKPKDQIHNLTVAGALIAAEIDRLQRAK